MKYNSYHNIEEDQMTKNEFFNILSNLKDINWNSNQYTFYAPQIKDYLTGLKEMPPLISVPELIDYYSNGVLPDVSLIDFSELTDQQKIFISITFISSLFLEYLLHVDRRPLIIDHILEHCFGIEEGSEEYQGLVLLGIGENEGLFDEIFSSEDNRDTYSDLDAFLDGTYFYKDKCIPYIISSLFKNNLESKNDEHCDACIHKFLKKDFVYSQVENTILRFLGINSIGQLDFNLSAPPIKVVFNHLKKAKRSYLFLLKSLFLFSNQIEAFHFDYKRYNYLYEMVADENYNDFCNFVYGLEQPQINVLFGLIEQIFPLGLIIEHDIISHYDNIETTLFSENLIYQPYFKSSLTSMLLILMGNYLMSKAFFLHIEYDVISHSFFKIFGSKPFDYFIIWTRTEFQLISSYFQKFFSDQNLFGITSNNTEIFDDKNYFTKEQESTIIDDSNPEQPESNDGDPKGKIQPGSIEVKPKRHLSVGHDIEVIKKLATKLVEGYTNKRGSIQSLVSSNDEKNITINKLVFLFTGNKDYSFDGPYNLTWNAEQVYLKLLIKLLHNLKELATGSHAVDVGRVDYISDKYIECRLTGGVWPKVAEAFENIKSGATIRNADYKKNYKDTKALINIKRQREMKVIADLWLKCKDDIDF